MSRLRAAILGALSERSENAEAIARRLLDGDDPTPGFLREVRDELMALRVEGALHCRAEARGGQALGWRYARRLLAESAAAEREVCS